MSMTNGSFAAPTSPDLTKEIQSFVVSVPAGAGAPQVVNPTVAVQAFTAYNYTNNLVRGTVTFSAGVTATGAIPTRSFLVPPGATASIDFADSDGDNALGAIDSIDVITFIAVIAGATTAEASTLATATAATAGLLYVNFSAS